ANALSDRMVEARAAMACLREVDPALRLGNLEWVAPPLRRAEGRVPFIESLRQTGLPEGPDNPAPRPETPHPAPCPGEGACAAEKIVETAKAPLHHGRAREIHQGRCDGQSRCDHRLISLARFH